MDFFVFKDIVFDLINECDQINIKDIIVHDAQDRICVVLESGLQVEITFRIMEDCQHERA